jgi:hypothetical protein
VSAWKGAFRIRVAGKQKDVTMPQDVPHLSPRERGAIVETLQRWAAVHPRRNLPLLGFLDGSELTPAEIAEAVASPESPRGQFLLRVFAAGLIPDRVEEPEELTQILADFQRDAETGFRGGFF